jgi:hypothetical protein
METPYPNERVYHYLVLQDQNTHLGRALYVVPMEDDDSTSFETIGRFVLESLASIQDPYEFPEQVSIEIFIHGMTKDEHLKQQSIVADTDAVDVLLNDPRTYHI